MTGGQIQGKWFRLVRINGVEFEITEFELAESNCIFVVCLNKVFHSFHSSILVSLSSMFIIFRFSTAYIFVF